MNGPVVPSFREIFEANARFVWRVLWTLGVPADDIEDLSQETFVVVHRRLKDFDGRSVRGWLYAICVRVASEHRRRPHVRNERISAMPERELSVPATQADDLEQRRTQDRLQAVLLRLDPDKRAAFVLYELEELTLREVATTLGCPLQTAYSRVQAARRLLTQAFEESDVQGARRIS